MQQTLIDLEEKEALGYLAREIIKLKNNSTIIISLVGGEAAGSTTFSEKLSKLLHKCEVVSTDDALIGDRLYRRSNLEGKHPLLKYDTKLFESKIEQIKDLKNGKFVMMPRYEQGSGLACSAREENFNRKIVKLDYLIIEGAVHFIHNPDLLIFMDVPDKTRLANRIKRGFAKRNEKSEEEIKRSFKLRQGTEYQAHIKPIKEEADILLKINATALDAGFAYKYSIYLKKK